MKKKFVWMTKGIFGVAILMAPLLILHPTHASTLSVAQQNSGKILLQVESHGEAWYVFPKDLKRYFLGRPADAFSAMRSLGLGVTNVNLAKIPISTSSAQGDLTLRQRLSGRILLQTESHGEAWYVYPKNLKRYYLGRPADAFSVMRTLGLGITNTNLSKITVGIIYDTSKPHFTDGTHTVGGDIQAGTYRTRIASSGCYFERLSGFGGTLDEIIANDSTDNPAVVTIASSDKGFQTSRCGTWTQDLSAITTSKTSFGNGIFIIGTDINPGTYKNTSQSGCYYARLSGFGGTLDEIITNENTDTQAIVTINSTDVGFESRRCGPWTPL